MNVNQLKIVIASIFLVASFTLVAQNKFDYTWKIGYGQEGKKYRNGALLNFTSDSLTITVDSITVGLFFTNAAICRDNGSLLCYSGGYWLEDSTSNVISGSRNLVGIKEGTTKTNLEKTGSIGGMQGMLMLPTPAAENEEFFVFNFFSDSIKTTHPDDFICSRVKFTQNDITVENKNHFITKGRTFYSAFLTACRHGNGRDWWIFAVEANYTKAHLFLFTRNGIEEDHEIDWKVPVVDPISDGVACFTNDGKKLAVYSHYNGLWLFDFDRCGGNLSNLQTIPIKGEAVEIFHNWGIGMANSQSGRFLYVSRTLYLYQFDLHAADISASKVLLGEYDGFIDTFSGFPVGFNLLQLAPNNKIYGSTTNGSRFLHVIENPEEKGTKCNFRPHSLLLPILNSFSLPNYPNYRLGAALGSRCDSLSEQPVDLSAVLVFPNPSLAGEPLTVQYSGNEQESFLLYDITGRLLFRQMLQQVAHQQTIRIPSVPVGTYLWKVGRKAGKLQIH
jgi:hypothetical protein